MNSNITTDADIIFVPEAEIRRFKADKRREGYTIVRSAPSLYGFNVTIERRVPVQR